MTIFDAFAIALRHLAGSSGQPPPQSAFVVVIDPGHGGDDTGAMGPSGLAEKDVTLDVAKRLKARIQSEMDAEVILTRDTDRTMTLDERTAIANHHRADLFVCIHANASRRGNARGAETYFLSYQANQGLPFVPTYKLSAELPNADTLVPGNEVRIGGIRVGQIKSIDPEELHRLMEVPHEPDDFQRQWPLIARRSSLVSIGFCR